MPGVGLAGNAHIHLASLGGITLLLVPPGYAHTHREAALEIGQPLTSPPRGPARESRSPLFQSPHRREPPHPLRRCASCRSLRAVLKPALRRSVQNGGAPGGKPLSDGLETGLPTSSSLFRSRTIRDAEPAQPAFDAVKAMATPLHIQSAGPTTACVHTAGVVWSVPRGQTVSDAEQKTRLCGSCFVWPEARFEHVAKPRGGAVHAPSQAWCAAAAATQSSTAAFVPEGDSICTSCRISGAWCCLRRAPARRARMGWRIGARAFANLSR